MKDIYDDIDEKPTFFELITDDSIREFVKSMDYLCKLAAATSVDSAKGEAIGFIQEIITWLERLANTFDSGSVVLKSEAIIRLLDRMGKVIKDACHYASDYLSSEVGSNQLSVKGQIQNYRRDFIKIASVFDLVTARQLPDSISDVIDELTYPAQNEKSLIWTMTENWDVAERVEFIIRRLRSRLTENPSYVDQEKHPCEPGTRLDVLEDIISWIKDISGESQCFYWLSGPPGVGKSAITASIAKECLNLGILGAQFFINRNDATTTDPRVLFPTICAQLCERFPRTVAIAMEKVLRSQPTLIDDISIDQAVKLFSSAVVLAAGTDLTKAVVVVIDALDEIDTKRLRHITHIFSEVVTKLPRNAKVFISSRAEQAITRPFNLLRDQERVKFRYLELRESIDEVSNFMEKKVKNILKDYDIEWADWGNDRMERLSSQASGLYIWADTALKFLQAEIETFGYSGKLLDKLTPDNMHDVNILYLNILRRTCKPGNWEYQKFRRVFGAILVCRTPLSIANIGQLLDLEDPVYFGPVDLVHFVRQYRTVLAHHTEEITSLAIPKMHKSFSDFITSDWAQEFRIDLSASHGELALRCMNQLGSLIAYLDANDETSTLFPVQLAYTSRYWQTHLTRMVDPNGAKEMNDYDTLNIPEFEEDDNNGLPAASFSARDWRPQTEKARKFLSYAFSPDGTQIASAYKGGSIQIRDAKTGLLTKFLIGHEDSVGSIGFSPDGTQLVSTSYDHTARIWDTQTERELHVLRGHTGTVRYAAFSHDGRIVVTCSLDSTLRTWSPSTGRLLNVFNGHQHRVDFCTFSSNDQCIASYSVGGDIMVWNVTSGNLISRFEHDGCEMIAFCPDGDHLMSCDHDGEVKLWDPELGNQLDHINPTIAQLASVEDSEQESGSNYIHVPRPSARSADGDSSTPVIYTLKTKTGTVYGIVECGLGVWKLSNDSQRLHFFAGATRMDQLEIDG